MVKAQARQDIKEITSNLNDWAKVITFTAPTGEVATINGIHMKHHVKVETDDGKVVNSKTARATFVWQLLVDQGYPVFNGSGEMNFRKHKLAATDSSGSLRTYEIMEWFPDTTVGLVLCILADKV